MNPQTEILLVDDEKEFADLLAKRLRSRGYAVQVAYTAAEALGLARNKTYSAAILDVSLPDGNGYQLFDDITGIHPEIRVIMLTGHGDLQMAFHLGKKGLCAYFSKPCDIQELTDELSKALKA